MIDQDFRDRILAAPEKLLDDHDVMKALMRASEAQAGNNIVDLRGLAMDKLENRLEKLEETHRSVIAAAYENLAGTNQIHRAILELLDPVTFEEFLDALGGKVAAALKVDCVALVLESEHAAPKMPINPILRITEPEFVAGYISGGRNATATRPVVLRQVQPDNGALYGAAAAWIGSEAVMRLDFGPRRLPGMLLLGAEDPHHFKPIHGTDLLSFFAAVFQRSMRRWLS